MIKEVGILHNIRDNGRRCGDFIFPPKQIDYKELIDNTFISILNSKNLSIILEKRIEIWNVAGSNVHKNLANMNALWSGGTLWVYMWHRKLCCSTIFM